MKTIISLSVFVVTLLAFATSSNAQTTVLNPRFDTYTACDAKNTRTFSSEKVLKTMNHTKRGNQKFEAFVQFEMSRKDFREREKLLKATFRIYETGTGLQEEKDFLVAYLTENGWNNTLSGAQRAELKLSSSPVSRNIKTFKKKENAPGTWYEVDVTQIVKNSPERFISFRIYNRPGVDDPDALIFSSSENKENAPELVLEF